MISVILPCLNEEEGIRNCIEKIEDVFIKNCWDGEIIVVDNGCTDRTVEYAKQYAFVEVFKEKNKGYGNAYKKGFSVAKGDIIVMGDADDTYDFNEIPRLIYALTKCDFVVGNRKNLEKNSMPFLHRYIGRPIFKLLMQGVFNLKISDSHCGFGAIKKEALNKLDLKSEGMEFASEILIKATKAGLIIGEIDINYSIRKGESKLRTFPDGWRHLKLITKEAI